MHHHLSDNKNIKNATIHHDENITIELMTHPGYIDEYTKSITSYVDRDKELEILKEAKENKIFNKIDLINFKQLYIK